MTTGMANGGFTTTTPATQRPTPGDGPPTGAVARLGVRRRGGHPEKVSILFVDDNEAEIEQITALANRLLVCLHVARDLDEATRIAGTHWLDGVISSVPPDRVTPLGFMRQLQTLDEEPPLPIALLGDYHPVADRWAAVHAGVVAFLERPLGADELWSVSQRFASMRRIGRPLVLAAVGGHHHKWEWLTWLDGVAVNLTLVEEVQEVLRAAEENPPALFLLALDDTEMDPGRLTRVLRSYHLWQDLPVMVLTDRGSGAFELPQYALGIDDVLPGTVSPEELSARVRARITRTRVLQDRANSDLLTGLLSRRGFAEALRARLAHARRRHQPLTVALIDLDDLKSINDRFGHIAGDQVLRTLGTMLRRHFRAGDVSARFGGDEFVVALDGEERHKAVEALHRLLDHFRGLSFPCDDSQEFRASFTAGVATAPRDADGQESLLSIADQRLYVGKCSGKNCVIP